MKLRKIQKTDGPMVQALMPSGWVSLRGAPGLDQIATEHGVEVPLATDLLGVLQLGPAGLAQLTGALSGLSPDDAAGDAGTETLPFEPRSFRDFMLYEDHVIDASRGYTKRFMPGVHKLATTIEKVTGKPFAKFKPHALWYKQPIYYLSNHLNFLVSGQDAPWPSHTQALDYELELGAILSHPLLNGSVDEAREAIGGFVVLNDFSARDVQVAEMNSGFGPQRAKHFYSAMSPIVVTADEVLPIMDSLTGSVRINGKRVAQCSSTGSQFSLVEAIAFVSRDEQLHPGELFGSGTLPGGSGMENGHWLKPGDTLTLTIDQIGELTNSIVTSTNQGGQVL